MVAGYRIIAQTYPGDSDKDVAVDESARFHSPVTGTVLQPQSHGDTRIGYYGLPDSGSMSGRNCRILPGPAERGTEQPGVQHHRHRITPRCYYPSHVPCADDAVNYFRSLSFRLQEIISKHLLMIL